MWNNSCIKNCFLRELIWCLNIFTTHFCTFKSRTYIIYYALLHRFASLQYIILTQFLRVFILHTSIRPFLEFLMFVFISIIAEEIYFYTNSLHLIHVCKNLLYLCTVHFVYLFSCFLSLWNTCTMLGLSPMPMWLELVFC